MSLTGGFFNSKDHDRRYNAETISRLFDGIIEDGVYETYGDKFIVCQASGMDVTIGSARAWFDHCWIHNATKYRICPFHTSPSPPDRHKSRMPSSA